MSLPPPPGSIGHINRSGVGPRAITGAKPVVKYDDDQRAVIECQSKRIVVGAFSGSGKTTTSVGYADARPNERILYLCFGKANQVEAKARFGAHVDCKTTHAVAYGDIGHKFNGQIAMQWRAKEFAAQLRLPSVRMAATLQDVLGQFFTSTDATLLPRHVQAVMDKWNLGPNEIEPMVAQARFAWSKMQQVGSGVQMPPDCYLKMWALTNPKLSKYSTIILDEAQDTNPVTARVVEMQAHATQLLIGDRHQSIYLFRGAKNAMEQFTASGATLLHLPRSWRFGPEIAEYANKLLGFFKNEEVKIIGAGPGAPRRAEKKKVVLSRTNAGLFAEAAAVLGKDTHWMGGIQKYKIEALTQSYLLNAGRRNEITDPNFRGYASWQQFKDEVESTRDVEGRMLVKLNDTYGKDIPYIVKCFYSNALETEAGAKLVLSTAHGAKGLDWDYVQIGDDFGCITKALDAMKLNPLAPLTPELEQEIHLLYVGITRARHQVDLNEETKLFFANIERHYGELMEARAKARPISQTLSNPGAHQEASIQPATCQ